MSIDNVDGEAVLEKLKQFKAVGASCEEGVIHYCYVFFRTDEVVEKLGQTEKMCNSILDLYRILEHREKKSYWHMHHREEFQNLGLRIILTSGIELADFEISYIPENFIQYCNKLTESERKMQIQKVAELFLLCFKLRDVDMQEELEEFFYNLPTHNKVRREMIFKIREACGIEVSD